MPRGTDCFQTNIFQSKPRCAGHSPLWRGQKQGSGMRDTRSKAQIPLVSRNVWDTHGKKGFCRHQAQENTKQTLKSFDLGLCAQRSSSKPLEDEITRCNCWMGWRSGSRLEKQGAPTAFPKPHLHLFKLASLVVSGVHKACANTWDCPLVWNAYHQCPRCYSFPRKKNYSEDIFQGSHFSAVTFSQTVGGIKTKATGITRGGEMEF